MPLLPSPVPAAESSAIVRLLTCGSVDDGKSTLIGRMFWDATSIAEDQRTAIIHASQNRLQNGEKVDFSLLLDGLQAEREQGITIDIAWRYFETTHRRFVVIDAPGHEQYTRNMATGASHADVAILLVDARHGVKRQTRRHAAICDLVGIKNVVLAVLNKMDLIDYSKRPSAPSRRSSGRSRRASTSIALSPFRWRRCPATMWCAASAGPALVWRSPRSRPSGNPRCRHRAARRAVLLPVQLVLRHGDFRGYAGTVASERIRPGDRSVDARSGLGATVRRITTMDGDLAFAHKGEAVAVELDTDLDISRGAILSEVQPAPDQRRCARGAPRLARRSAFRP